MATSDEPCSLIGIGVGGLATSDEPCSVRMIAGDGAEVIVSGVCAVGTAAEVPAVAGINVVLVLPVVVAIGVGGMVEVMSCITFPPSAGITTAGFVVLPLLLYFNRKTAANTAIATVMTIASKANPIRKGVHVA